MLEWISFKEKLPPLGEYILVTDEKKTYPHYTKDLSVFVTENKDPVPTIQTECGHKIKTTCLIYWCVLPLFIDESCK